MNVYLKKMVILLFAVSVIFSSCARTDDNDNYNKTDDKNKSVVNELEDENTYIGENSSYIKDDISECDTDGDGEDNNQCKNDDNKNEEIKETEKEEIEEHKKSDGNETPDTNKEQSSEENNEEQQVISLKAVSVEEAGLEAIQNSDLKKYVINTRIIELVDNPSLYKDKDYADGLVQDSGCIIISERFQGNIIDRLKIGSTIDGVKGLLGSPGFTVDDFIIYKTDKYYIGLKGKSRVELAVIQKYNSKYDKDILKYIIKAFNKGEIQSVLHKDLKIADFFEISGYVKGGGWYAESFNGIAALELDARSITVYNNFKGELYEYVDEQQGDFKILFQDEDYIAQHLVKHLKHYVNANERFNKEGKISPSGKLISIFDWNYSTSHYFTIRTVQNIRPDFIIDAPSADYEWLSDDYILYIDAWSNMPFLLRVSENYPDRVNVLYKVGILDNSDYLEYIGDYNFEIFETGSSSFILKDTKNNSKYKVYYKDIGHEILLSLDEDIQQSNSKEIVTSDLSIGNITLGMSYEMLTKVFEMQPTNITKNDDFEGITKILEYDDGTIIELFDNIVYSVSVFSPSYETHRGLRVGDSIKRLGEFYGEPTVKNDDVWIFEAFEGYVVLNVEIRENKVYGIIFNMVM